MSSLAIISHPTFQILSALIVLMLVVGCVTHQQPLTPSPYQSWLAYYNDEAAPEAFRGYDVVVFDADKHPDIWTVKSQGSKVLAYISLAEIADYRDYANRFVGTPKQVIGTNEIWQTKVIDIRRKDWQQFLLNEWLPSAMNKGFDGVFIDTIDTALEWEKRGQSYSNMADAAVDIVTQIRAHLPQGKLIMVNRGVEVLPQLAQSIDIVLAESILIDASNQDKNYFPVKVYEHYVDILQQLRQKHSHLSVFTLDYPKTIDKTTWLQICRMQKKHGFVPYISTADLQQINASFIRCN